MSQSSPDELRKQVVRRMRYATNVMALESNSVPPEGPLDVAMTNGLAAIVAYVNPQDVYETGRNGVQRMLSARKLIDVALGFGISIDRQALLEALGLTQPMRHGNADDEWVAPATKHLDALRALDTHPGLGVLKLAAKTRDVDALLVELYGDAAREASNAPVAYDAGPGYYLEPEECDECWRMTFMPYGHDQFGGTNSPGVCAACGYERSSELAYRLALDSEWERWSDRE